MLVRSRVEVTLTEGDVREAICQWVRQSMCGDGPGVTLGSVEIYTKGAVRHGSGFSAVASTSDPTQAEPKP